MSLASLTGPARRFLLLRLERLRRSLEDLGHRLRQGIAEIIGRETGEAVRDAIDGALQPEHSASSSTSRSHDSGGSVPPPESRDWQWDPSDPSEPFWEDPEEGHGSMAPTEPRPVLRPPRPRLTAGAALLLSGSARARSAQRGPESVAVS